LPGLVAQDAQVGLADFPGSADSSAELAEDLDDEELRVGVGDEGIAGRGTIGRLIRRRCW
jgi:hypothetical protein